MTCDVFDLRATTVASMTIEVNLEEARLIDGHGLLRMSLPGAPVEYGLDVFVEHGARALKMLVGERVTIRLLPKQGKFLFLHCPHEISGTAHRITRRVIHDHDPTPPGSHIDGFGPP